MPEAVKLGFGLRQVLLAKHTSDLSASFAVCLPPSLRIGFLAELTLCVNNTDSVLPSTSQAQAMILSQRAHGRAQPLFRKRSESNLFRDRAERNQISRIWLIEHTGGTSPLQIALCLLSYMHVGRCHS